MTFIISRYEEKAEAERKNAPELARRNLWNLMGECGKNIGGVEE
jgi:hypothetical protein